MQVDLNVTRHLHKDLVEKDWDVLILHYLGLDHIGHLAGPYSPLVKPKLQEMDSVIRQIYDALATEVILLLQAPFTSPITLPYNLRFSDSKLRQLKVCTVHIIYKYNYILE
jgi:predicted AlkP superfamily pyrophosphatase or phosphodiesterase